MSRAKEFNKMIEIKEKGKVKEPIDGPVILSNPQAFNVISQVVSEIDWDILDLKGSDAIAQKMLDSLEKMKIKLMKE